MNSLDWFVQAATRPPGGAFGRPVDVSAREGDSPSPQVAIGDTGDALVVWHGFHDRHSLAEIAAYDASPPRIDGISVPAAVSAGTTAQMSAVASDVSSQVTTTWSFGDGSIAEGDAVAHAYAQGGSYEVRVTATDAVGHTATATRQIAVAPAASPPLVLTRPALTAPVLSRLRLSPAAFRVAGSAGHAVRLGMRGARTGSHVRFRLDEFAKLSFAVERRTTGRRVHGRCVRGRRNNRSARPCARYVALHGHLTRLFAPGDGSFSFTGRLNGHALAPGSYVLVATPSLSAVRGRSARAAFRILS